MVQRFLSGLLLLLVLFGALNCSTSVVYAQGAATNAGSLDSVKLGVPIPGADPEGETLYDVSGGDTGNVVFDYISALFKWVSAIIGAIAILMIIIAGLMMVFSSGNQSVVDEAKSRLIGAILGLVLLITGATILWLLNPGFFGKVGVEAPRPISGPEAKNFPNTVQIFDTYVRDSEGNKSCENEGIRTAALEVIKLHRQGLVNLKSVANIPGSSPFSNVNDLANGRCPITERQDASGEPRNLGPELNPANVAAQLGKAKGTLEALGKLVKINGGPYNSVTISSLFGDNHSGKQHRQMYAFDIAILDGQPVLGISGDAAKVCALANQLKGAVGASKVIGPRSMKGVCDGGGIVSDSKGGHDNHFHVDL